MDDLVVVGDTDSTDETGREAPTSLLLQNIPLVVDRGSIKSDVNGIFSGDER